MELLKKANGNLPRSEEEKAEMIKNAAEHYGKFLTALGYDWRADENSANTPTRYAKSFVEDIVAGSLNAAPTITAFPNDGYSGIVAQTNVTIRSLCSHHHREVYGKCHIGYIPSEDGKVVGLSKLNRIAQFYASRFQLQESLTKQVHDHVNEMCEGNLGVVCVIEAEHSCVKCRGVRDESKMFTSEVSGFFKSNEIGSRDEFYRMIDLSKK